eukprot:798826-Heterocapsa_arctica.AAC.1
MGGLSRDLRPGVVFSSPGASRRRRVTSQAGNVPVVVVDWYTTRDEVADVLQLCEHSNNVRRG